MNILVVDDETIQLAGLRIGLQSRGYKVLTASSGKEVLEILNNYQNKFELIITDYVMPGMDGIALLRKIREGNKSLPILMMTAYGKKDLVVDALRNRCDGFIEKPFSLDQLIKEIERVRIDTIQNTHFHQLPELIHQINNPLAAITGSAQLALLDLNDDKSVKEYLTHIIEASEKIETVNKEIMKFEQSAEDTTEELNITTLLEGCLLLFKDLLLIKGIKVEQDFQSSGLLVKGNRFKMEQIFKNLILNSIDSMDDRPEKHLKVYTTFNKNTLTISTHIRDTGCGIPDEAMDKIFNKYFSNKKHGTGLGLTVVKSFVEENKGKIHVESEMGEGTTFIISFPVSDFIYLN